MVCKIYLNKALKSKVQEENKTENEPEVEATTPAEN